MRNSIYQQWSFLKNARKRKTWSSLKIQLCPCLRRGRQLELVAKRQENLEFETWRFKTWTD